MLRQIKGQKSIHDPSLPQFGDKLYYTLQSTDATPAAFYGLPKIHKPDVELYSIEDDAEFNKGGMFGSLKGIIFIRTFLLVSIKGLCLKVFLVYNLFVG